MIGYVFLFIGLFCVKVFPIYFIAKRQEKKRFLRAKSLRQIAKTMDYPFQEKSIRFDRFCQNLSIFSVKPQGFNFLSISGFGGKLKVFDVVEPNKFGNSALQTVYWLEFPSNSKKIPEFTIKPKTASWFKYNSITFNDFPEFDSRFRITGNDEKAIRAVFTPELIGIIEKEKGSLYIQFYRNSLFIYCSGEYINPNEADIQKFFKRYHSIGMAFK